MSSTGRRTTSPGPRQQRSPLAHGPRPTSAQRSQQNFSCASLPLFFDVCRFLAGFAVYPMPVSLGPCRLFRRDGCCGTAAILNCMKNPAAWHPLLLDYDRACGSIGRSIVAGGHSVLALFMRSLATPPTVVASNSPDSPSDSALVRQARILECEMPGLQTTNRRSLPHRLICRRWPRAGAGARCRHRPKKWPRKTGAISRLS